MRAYSAAQLCPTLCNPMDCSLPDSSVHEIFQARKLEWFPTLGDLPGSGIEATSPMSLALPGGFFTTAPPQKPQWYLKCGCQNSSIRITWKLLPLQVPRLHPRSQFSSFTQLCPALCNTMDCSTPGFPVHYQLPEFAQTHVHWISDAIQPSHPLSFPSPPIFNPSQHQGLFH